MPVLPSRSRTALVAAGLLLAWPSSLAMAKPRHAIAFPANFMWGAATAAHQVEGGLNNDWVPFEAEPGFAANGDTSTLGVEHYKRFDADFAAAQAMGHNVHRLSVEWARIEPTRGQRDWAAIDHYHEVFRALRARGMRPMVTLHHFTNPPWIAARGGWLAEQTQSDFANFAAFMGREFGGEVDMWITINEPNVYAFNAFDAGLWPPRHKSREEALRVMGNLVKGHARAYHALHQSDHGDADGDGTPACVGVAQHIALMDPLSAWNAVDVATAYFNDQVFNRAGLRGITTGIIKFQVPGTRGVNEIDRCAASSCDFLGINYYTRWRCDPGGPKARIPTPGAPVTALGWENYPEGMYRALALANEYSHLPDGRRIPIIITENGIDDRTDAERAPYMVRHLQQVARAIEDGIDVRGYIHWTLMDNFEWSDGYAPKFGLYQIDRRPGKDLARHPSAGVDIFRQITAANGLSLELLTQYGEP